MIDGTRYVETAERRLHVLDLGRRDRPVVILVHGLGGSLLNWACMAPLLARTHRVVASDLPGFGLSPPARRHDLDTHVRAITALIEWAGGGPAVLGAISMGGVLALKTAATRPDLVDRLVLFAPASPPPPGVRPPDLRLLARLALQSLPGIGSALTRGLQSRHPASELVALTLRLVAARPDSLDPTLIEELADLARRRREMPWAVRAFRESAGSLRSMLLHRSRLDEIVDAVRAPGLLIAGSEDRLVSPRSVESLARRGGFDFVRMEGVGHVPPMEAPADSARLFRDAAAA